METQSSPTYTASFDQNLSLIEYRELWGELGAFSTLRFDYTTKHRGAYFLHEHVERIFGDLEVLEINTPFTIESVFKKAREYLLSIEKMGQYLFRICVTPNEVSFCATLWDEPEVMLTAEVMTYDRPDADTKNLDYQPIIDALHGIDRKHQEILIQSTDGFLREGATTNLIFMKEGTLYVPFTDCLPGLTINRFLDLVEGKMPIVEQDIPTSTIDEYDEILCVGSGKGVCGILQIPSIGWERKTYQGVLNLRIMYDNFLIDYRYGK